MGLIIFQNFEIFYGRVETLSITNFEKLFFGRVKTLSITNFEHFSLCAWKPQLQNDMLIYFFGNHLSKLSLQGIIVPGKLRSELCAWGVKIRKFRFENLSIIPLYQPEHSLIFLQNLLERTRFVQNHQIRSF